MLSNASYWDERYGAIGLTTSEWYSVDYKSLRHVLVPHLIGELKVLVPGCGNSALAVDIAREGKEGGIYVEAVDFSHVGRDFRH